MAGSALLIRVASAAANRLCVAPDGAAPAPIPPNSRLGEPSRDGLLRNQQDPGRFAVHAACACSSLNIAAGAMFAPHKPAKPGYEIAVTEQSRRPAAAGAAAPEEPIEKLLATADGRAGRGRGQEVRGLPYLRQGRAEPGRSEPVRRGRARARLACGIQLFGRHEGASPASGRSKTSTRS